MVSTTAQTQASYLRRAELLLADYAKHSGQSWRDDPLAAMGFLAEKRRTLARSSWRQYKASLIYFMKLHGPREAVDYLRSVSGEECLKRSNRTSAQKMKGLPQKDLARVIQALLQRDCQYDALVALWLVCGLLTGLRPSEWSHAILDGDKLRVANAKNTNGRGLGVERVISLAGLTDTHCRAIEEFLRRRDRFLAKADRFDRLYHSCKDALYSICKRIWPTEDRRPSLYSPRHQLVADLKRSGLALEDIAAILGHASNATASEHYGRRAAGRGRKHIVSADPLIASQVRRKYTSQHPMTGKKTG